MSKLCPVFKVEKKLTVFQIYEFCTLEFWKYDSMKIIEQCVIFEMIPK